MSMQPRPDQPLDYVLPTPSAQAASAQAQAMYELAKSLPPPRKQNTACDACRSRKVKCHRLPGQEKVTLTFLGYSLSVTQSSLVALSFQELSLHQATSEKKRNAAGTRRPRAASNGGTSIPSPVSSKITSPTTEDNITIPPYLQPGSQLPLPIKYGLYPPITVQTPTRDVLAYLFSPPENIIDPNPFAHHRSKSLYGVWGESAEKLADPEFRTELAFDLVEVYFQIVHSRLPLLNPDQFREQLRLQLSSNSGTEKPLHPALVATVIAWGSKFSEHQLLITDRSTHGGQGHLSKTLIDRARDLAEALKVHRVPNADHVVIALLIETLQSQIQNESGCFLGFWLTAATRHLLELGINHKQVAATLADPDERGPLIFAWWMACICDAFSALYYRRKPLLDDDDYDIDFYLVGPISTDGQPSTREQLEFLGYYRAAHSLARTARSMARKLWRPATEGDGIPLEVLRTFCQALCDWRTEFFDKVSVHMNDYSGDFVTTVSRFASDAQYHVMWIILYNAVDEFGVKEANEVHRTSTPPHNIPNGALIDDTTRKLVMEAVNSATRISTLVGVLASNDYLKLDPAVMLFSCIAAGQVLARIGRREVLQCITGLEQYSRSYEEAGDQAVEIRKTYQQVCGGHLFPGHLIGIAKQVPAPGLSSLQSPTVPTREVYMMNVDGEDGELNGKVQHAFLLSLCSTLTNVLYHQPNHSLSHSPVFS
uniref:Xylanolytic transcriptional activator regulatory domain-containing protein n=1 Tax=Moniliophthora roreri TaxID=221103 RepID=A0A0W0EVM0_MONRR